jgi:hypothetical protein
MEGSMRAAALAILAWSFFSPPAHADGIPSRAKPAVTPSQWVFEFTPYGWLPWVEGDAVVRGRGFNIYETPIDVLEDLDLAWMSYMQARNGPLTLFSDIIYGDLGSSGSLVRSESFSPHVSATVGAAVSAEYQFWIVEAGGMYEVMQTRSRASATAPDTHLELLAGGRYWYQELNVDLALAGTANLDGLIVSGNLALARSGSVDWIDPFVGARLRYEPGPGEEIALRGDVGGFGAGSQFTWQVIATYSWLLCTQGGLTLDGYLGYRALSVDYVEGAGVTRYEFDVIQHGPVIGVTGRF